MRKRRGITEGEGSLGVIYERLRKRSYRRWLYSDWCEWTDSHHQGYVEGARDALNEVALRCGNPAKGAR
jgi:hypothetical protein